LCRLLSSVMDEILPAVIVRVPGKILLRNTSTILAEIFIAEVMREQEETKRRRAEEKKTRPYLDFPGPVLLTGLDDNRLVVCPHVSVDVFLGYHTEAGLHRAFK